MNLSSLRISDSIKFESIPPEVLLGIYEAIEEKKGETLDRGPLSSKLLPFFLAKLYYNVYLKRTYRLLAFYKAIKRNPNWGELVHNFKVIDRKSLEVVLSAGQIKELFVLMPNLIRLHVRCPQISEIVLDPSFPGEHFQDLEFLKMNHIELDSTRSLEQLHALDGFKRLNRLSLSITGTLGQNGIDIFENRKKLFKNLKHVELKGDVSNPIIIKFFEGIKALQSLQLVSDRRFDRSLRNFNSVLSVINPSLERLVLADASIIHVAPDREEPMYPINSIIPRFSKLKDLRIRARIIDGGLNSLLSLREIEYLELGWGSSVPWEYIYAYLQNLDFTSALEILCLYDTKPRTAHNLEESALWKIQNAEMDLIKAEANRVGAKILERVKF